MKIKCKYCSKKYTFLKNVLKHELKYHKDILELYKQFPNSEIKKIRGVNIIQLKKVI